MHMWETVTLGSGTMVEGSLRRVCLTAGDGAIGSLKPVPLSPWARHISPGLNPDFKAKTLRFSTESPGHAEHSYDYRYNCCDACRPSPAVISLLASRSTSVQDSNKKRFLFI